MQDLDGSPLSADSFSVTAQCGPVPGIAGITTADDRIVEVELTGIIPLQC